MKTKTIIIFLLISVVFTSLLYPARIEAELIRVEDMEKTVMDEFSLLIEKMNGVSDVLEFINNNISFISNEDASRMINEFEEIQKENLSKLEEKYFSEDIQNKIYNIYKRGFDLDKINDRNKIGMMDDQHLKELLLETRNTGYKVETAEGMFFPIIDYEYHRRYSSHVTDDMKEYIEIMAVESNRVPAKDAALIIGWDEILKRALTQEVFINQYQDSVKINDIKELYKKYLTFTLFGLNNTPLFSYDSRTMVPDAKNVYQKAVNSDENSMFIQTLKEFLGLLKANNYRLTEEVEKYRKSLVEKFFPSIL